MLMWYPSNSGYIAFWGIKVIVLPSKPGHLSTISLNKTAISANFMNVPTSLSFRICSIRNFWVKGANEICAGLEELRGPRGFEP